MTLLPRTALAAAAAACLSPAYAGRPLVTEDAGVKAPRACEVQAYGARQAAAGERLRATVLQLGCGVGAGSELALGVARERDAQGAARSVELSGKTSLRDGGDDAPSFTLAYAVASPQRNAHVAGWALNGVMSWPFAADWGLHANLGTARDRDAGQARTTWALAVERTGLGPFDLMAEVYADDRERDPWVQAGVRWAVLPERLWLDASWGVQAARPRPSAVTLGVKLAF